MALTLAQAQEQLAAALASLSKVRQSEEYRIGGMQLRRALLRDANADVELWESKVSAIESAALRGSRIRRRRIVPRDT